MSRQPRENPWLSFFFKSPTRFFTILLIGFVIFAMIRPDLAQTALYNALAAIVAAVTPFIGPLLVICIVVFAIFYLILRPFRRKKKKKDEH